MYYLVLSVLARFCHNITSELQNDCIPTLCDIGIKLGFDWFPISVVCIHFYVCVCVCVCVFVHMLIIINIIAYVLYLCRLQLKPELVQLIFPCCVDKGVYWYWQYLHVFVFKPVMSKLPNQCAYNQVEYWANHLSSNQHLHQG